jgi:hypothetical protein
VGENPARLASPDPPEGDGVRETLSMEYLRAIVEREYTDPVVSLYLGLDSEKVASWIRI